MSSRTAVHGASSHEWLELFWTESTCRHLLVCATWGMIGVVATEPRENHRSVINTGTEYCTRGERFFRPCEISDCCTAIPTHHSTEKYVAAYPEAEGRDSR